MCVVSSQAVDDLLAVLLGLLARVWVRQIGFVTLHTVGNGLLACGELLHVSRHG